jgi:hypothetical protein
MITYQYQVYDYDSSKTGSNCTFETGSNCTFYTSHNCTFSAGSGCIFNTSYNCTFDADLAQITGQIISKNEISVEIPQDI